LDTGIERLIHTNVATSRHQLHSTRYCGELLTIIVHATVATYNGVSL